MKHKTTKGTIAFRIIYALLTLLAAAAIIFILNELWKILEAYEKSDPEISVKMFLSNFEQYKSELLKELHIECNEFENQSVIEDYFEKLTQGELSYSRNGKMSNDSKSVYNIKTTEGIIAEIEITKSEKEIGYGFYEYEMTGIKFGEVPTYKYSVTAPSNAEVFCNGKKISELYMIAKGDNYSGYEHFGEYIIDPPYSVTYEISGFLNDPVFTAEDSLGHKLTAENNVFSIAQAKEEELSQTALEFAKAYSRYVVNDGRLSDVAKFLAPEMPLYSELEGYENFWHNYHTSYDFLDVDVADPVFYTDSAVSVVVKYDHVLFGVNSAENGELHSKGDFTVYMVKLGREWQVTELVFN